MVNTGCVLLKEGQFEPARQKFNDAIAVVGYQARIQILLSLFTLDLVVLPAR